MRRIVSLKNMDKSQFILPTGQSGIPSSPHYSDQASLYNNGEYRTTLFDKNSMKLSEGIRELILIP